MCPAETPAAFGAGTCARTGSADIRNAISRSREDVVWRCIAYSCHEARFTNVPGPAERSGKCRRLPDAKLIQVSNLFAPYLRSIALRRELVRNFSSYPFALPAVVGLKAMQFPQPITFLIGENGSGKSTLLEAIAVALGLNAEGGSKNFRFSTRASHSELHGYLSLERGLTRPRDSFFFRAETYYNVATEIEHLDTDEEVSSAPPIALAYGERALHEQSHGESFLALVMHRFQGRGLYLMDEPEAALSPMRQMSLLSRLHELVVGGAQFIIATHSPILLAYPNATIYEFGAEGPLVTSYEDTEHFRVTRDFLTRHPAMLRVLLDDDRG
ncbi:MAG: AAA family ATPase [Phycisphaerae bacterium]|nr:AAA family ATPase [Gemmatimonadaceae bacterium]